MKTAEKLRKIFKFQRKKNAKRSMQMNKDKNLNFGYFSFSNCVENKTLLKSNYCLPVRQPFFDEVEIS